MTIHYPKGIKPLPEGKGIKKSKKLHLGHSAANRGMGFEADINESNAYYLEHDLCLVTKRPTPINVVKVDYTHGAKITQAYFETQSTTDYNGVYQGHYLDFEAKSTQSKTSFPLHNIPQQQIDHLKRVIHHGGIAFFIINCYALGQTYILAAQDVIDFYEAKPRSSIPMKDITSKGYLVKEGYNPRYDYLAVVKAHFLK
jgi:recombination protein U